MVQSSQLSCNSIGFDNGLDDGSLKVGKCCFVLRTDKVAPCGTKVWRFMVIDWGDEVEAMFPMVGGIWWRKNV